MSGSKNLKLAALMFFSLSFGVLHASFAQPAYGQTLKTLKSQWPRSARGTTLSARIDVSDYFNYKYMIGRPVIIRSKSLKDTRMFTVIAEDRPISALLLGQKSLRAGLLRTVTISSNSVMRFSNLDIGELG